MNDHWWHYIDMYGEGMVRWAYKGSLSIVPQSFRMRSCRCLTVFSHEASASLMYSLNDDRCPETLKIPGTVELTHSLEEDPSDVEWNTATKNRMPAANQSICVTRLGLLNSELFMI